MRGRHLASISLRLTFTLLPPLQALAQSDAEREEIKAHRAHVQVCRSPLPSPALLAPPPPPLSFPVSNLLGFAPPAFLIALDLPTRPPQPCPRPVLILDPFTPRSLPGQSEELAAERRRRSPATASTSKVGLPPLQVANQYKQTNLLYFKVITSKASEARSYMS